MRSAISGFRSPAVIILVALTLAAPLLGGETLCTDDGALHVYRTVALDRALRDGVLYPRWFPDLAYGYGFPFFVYREPLGYYLLEALHLLGLSIANAFNLTLAGSLVLSGLAMFWLARDIFGERGGLLAGVVYITAPYTLIGPLVRGNLPEVIAFAWMPLILLCIRRLVVLRQTRYFVASILAGAALFLTHNISSLLFVPLLLAYVALLVLARAEIGVDTPGAHRLPLFARLRPAIRDARYALCAILLVLALTAFFWLPALAEQGAAQVYLTHSSRGNDYHFNFIGLDELLGGPGTFDPALLNPPLRIRFGWPQLALAALGALTTLKARVPAGAHSSMLDGEDGAGERTTRREQRAMIIGAALAAIALGFMALPASLPLWDNLPLIRFVQFPWRFVGRAMLPAALLAAAAVISPQRTRRTQGTDRNNSALSAASAVKPLLFGIGVFVALLFSAPLSYPRACPTQHDLGISDVFAYERATGHIGVDPLGAYLPRTVIERPSGSPLEAQYAAGKPIERFDATALPDGARLLDARYGPNRADLVISTPAAFTATYLAFDFPGWSVRVDERPVEIRPSDPTGLITFEVPAGEHRIHVEFGDSPPRAFADGLSLIALAGAIASSVFLSRRSQPAPARPATQSTRHTSLVTRYTFFGLAVYLLVKTTLIDGGLTPLRATRLRGEALAGVSHPLEITFGDRLRLLGYDVSALSTQPGDMIRVDLHWKAMRPLDATLQAEVGIAGADGWPWSPKHAERPRDHTDFPPTPSWPLDTYVIDSFEIEVLPGTPPGEYALVAQVFDRRTLAPLQPSLASVPGRLAAPIGSIRVDRAARAFDAEQLRIYGGERHDLDDDLTLLGYNIDRVDSVPGDSVLLTFFWQAERTPKSDRVFRIELLGAANEALASRDILIGAAGYSTSNWQAGEQIISLVVMRVPAAAASGAYHWRGSLLDESGRLSGAFDMQPALRVAAPERTFDVPAMENRVNVDLGDFAALLGFDLGSDRLSAGGTVEVTLYWQARAETAHSYKVFVHLLDEGGRIVTQADAFPAGGKRPTTGWLAGEVIADRYALALPDDLKAGSYQLAAGLYDPESSKRLRTAGGSETTVLSVLDTR